MQQKTEGLQEKSSQMGLSLDFIYLGSNISTNGGADKDVELRINKARHAFRTLRLVWTSSQLSINTKICIFNTNVKPVLLYGCETWKTTQVSQQQTPSLHQQSPPIHP